MNSPYGEVCVDGILLTGMTFRKAGGVRTPGVRMVGAGV